LSSGANDGPFLKSLIYRARFLSFTSGCASIQFVVIYLIGLFILIYEKVDQKYWSYNAFWGILFAICEYYNAVDILFTLVQIHLLCLLLIERSKILKKKLLVMKPILEMKLNQTNRIGRIKTYVIGTDLDSVKQFIEGQNDICRQLSSINSFFKTPYAVMLIIGFPMSLTLFHQILFEDLTLIWRMFFCATVFGSWVFIFIINGESAKVSKAIHSTGNGLPLLQWTIKAGSIRKNPLSNQFSARISRMTSTKIKLLSCHERVSGPREIGFTIRSLYTLTFPFFHRVSFCFLKDYL